MYLAFTDLDKAFDKAPRTKVWKRLKDSGIDNKSIRIIQDLYKTTMNHVINQKDSELTSD